MGTQWEAVHPELRHFGLISFKSKYVKKHENVCLCLLSLFLPWQEYIWQNLTRVMSNLKEGNSAKNSSNWATCKSSQITWFVKETPSLVQFTLKKKWRLTVKLQPKLFVVKCYQPFLL